MKVKFFLAIVTAFFSKSDLEKNDRVFQILLNVFENYEGKGGGIYILIFSCFIMLAFRKNNLITGKAKSPSLTFSFLNFSVSLFDVCLAKNYYLIDK